mmetsp:Transcript_12683/g.35047  ORF Transcript_12683/g.35047 Transcript_12683/m.35047 type:complete len:317 (-) Transcript_12683:875-1825(-)
MHRMVGQPIVGAGPTDVELLHARAAHHMQGRLQVFVPHRTAHIGPGPGVRILSHVDPVAPQHHRPAAAGIGEREPWVWEEELPPVAARNPRAPQVHEVAGPAGAERPQGPGHRGRPVSGPHLDPEELLLERRLAQEGPTGAPLQPGVRLVRALTPPLRGAVLRRRPRELRPRDYRAAAGGARGGATAAQGHIGALAGGKVDLLDVAWDDVQVDAVLGEQLPLAVQAAFRAVRSRRPQDQGELDARKHETQPRPLSGTDGEARDPHGVYERKHRVPAHGLAVLVAPKVAKRPVLDPGGGPSGEAAAGPEDGEAEVHQ